MRYRGLALFALGVVIAVSACSPSGRKRAYSAERVTIESGGWRIVGDFVVPHAGAPTAAVVLLNQAAGDRAVYVELADQLARCGIASLRLDLRGHGESTNLGRFDPRAGTSILDGSEQDIVAAVTFVTHDRRIDPGRIGFVGASYSGELMMEAARLTKFGAAYVALSPGSLSDASITAIDREHIPFLLVVSRHERHVAEVVQAVRNQSRMAELLELNGNEHATDILVTHRGLAEIIAVWFRQQFE